LIDTCAASEHIAGACDTHLKDSKAFAIRKLGHSMSRHLRRCMKNALDGQQLQIHGKGALCVRLHGSAECRLYSEQQKEPRQSDHGSRRLRFGGESSVAEQ
jgi:hypothetical protein